MEIKTFKHKIKTKSGKRYTLNPVKEQWLTLTPEEKVRQNVIQTLHHLYGYPVRTMITELSMPYSTSNRKTTIRSDISVFLPSRIILKNGHIWEHDIFIVVECKKEGEPLHEKYLKKGLQYCEELLAYYLILTNGKETHVYAVQDNDYYFEVDDIPTYEQAFQAEWIPIGLTPSKWAEMVSCMDEEVDDLLPYIKRAPLNGIPYEIRREYHKKYT